MLFKRNYKTTVKSILQNEKGEMVEVMIPSYETEKVNDAQYVKGLFTDKAITKNEDGSPKEDHTMRNVLIGAAVIAGGYYYMTHKDEPATQDFKPLPESSYACISDTTAASTAASTAVSVNLH